MARIDRIKKISGKTIALDPFLTHDPVNPYHPVILSYESEAKITENKSTTAAAQTLKSEETAERMRATVDAVYRSESRRVLATLIRLLGDFDLAEDALHGAFKAALEQWPIDGLPANPRAWHVSAGRFKAIDSMRRRARFDSSLDMLRQQIEIDRIDPEAEIEKGIEDDELRLIFTCCTPPRPTSAGGWGERLKPGHPTSAPSASRGWSQSEDF